jgi:hypothetical protein
VSKVFGYDLAIEYWPGSLNTVADALSPREDEEVPLSALTFPSFKLFDDLHHELQENADHCALCDSVVADHGAPWRGVDGLILHGSCVYVPTTFVALPVVLQLAHSASHDGTQKTMQCLLQDFVIDDDR